ncbi:hypothetical protein C5167_015533 [Papaver somniferum]|uniref:Uncharacterized protein n=1 Tax=Papaver somniferum TaxID=3469 RepID=A0A4Y7J9S6_PAPSO|nr:hypothetical protein C5167_015533 [Papaver somniferum]
MKKEDRKSSINPSWTLPIDEHPQQMAVNNLITVEA